LRYEKSEADYLSMFDSEGSLFNARLAEIQTQAALYQ